jgi:hypothetical protein
MTVWVRHYDKLVKTTADHSCRYRMSGFSFSNEYWDGLCFSDAELPAARKALAAEKKAKMLAKEAREKRVADAKVVASELGASGVLGGEHYRGEAFKTPSVDIDGMIRCALTIEQARKLLAAL